MEEDEYEAWVELAESSQVMTAADGNSVILGVGHIGIHLRHRREIGRLSVQPTMIMSFCLRQLKSSFEKSSHRFSKIPAFTLSVKE